jgi:hypothetical protein
MNGSAARSVSLWKKRGFIAELAASNQVAQWAYA